MSIDPVAARIAAVFDRCFAASHRTVVRLGGDEPLYLPATATQCAEIVCNRDYPASVLHEVAHWCIASAARRRQVDYGYWYAPPPRDPTDQARFLAAEVKNQALESIFARAAGLDFEVSLDDLGADASARSTFAAEVRARARRLEAGGLGARATRFRAALAAAFCRG